MLRCLQIGLRISDLDELDYGLALDLIIEQGNDGCKYQQVATQDDFDKF